MINLQNVLDDVKCYETVRRLRWLTGSVVRTAARQRSRSRGAIPPNRHGRNIIVNVAIAVLTI